MESTSELTTVEKRDKILVLSIFSGIKKLTF